MGKCFKAKSMSYFKYYMKTFNTKKIKKVYNFGQRNFKFCDVITVSFRPITYVNNKL